MHHEISPPCWLRIYKELLVGCQSLMDLLDVYDLYCLDDVYVLRSPWISMSSAMYIGHRELYHLILFEKHLLESPIF